MIIRCHKERKVIATNKCNITTIITEAVNATYMGGVKGGNGGQSPLLSVEVYYFLQWIAYQ